MYVSMYFRQIHVAFCRRARVAMGMVHTVNVFLKIPPIPPRGGDITKEPMWPFGVLIT